MLSLRCEGRHLAGQSSPSATNYLSQVVGGKLGPTSTVGRFSQALGRRRNLPRPQLKSWSLSFRHEGLPHHEKSTLPSLYDTTRPGRIGVRALVNGFPVDDVGQMHRTLDGRKKKKRGVGPQLVFGFVVLRYRPEGAKSTKTLWRLGPRRRLLWCQAPPAKG